MDVNNYKTGKWEIQVFIPRVWREPRAGATSLAQGIEEVSGRRHGCWAVFWRVQRSSLSFWEWKGPEKVMVIWSGHMQPFRSSDLHQTLSSWQDILPANCALHFCFHLQEMHFYFFMKDVVNRTSLIKQCLGHLPTSINWRLPIRASEVAKITTLDGGNLGKSKPNWKCIQTGQLSCG